MNSTTGRMPIMVAPTASPEKAASLIGVSIILSDPYFQQAFRNLVRTLELCDLFAHEDDLVVTLNLLRKSLVECISISYGCHL